MRIVEKIRQYNPNIKIVIDGAQSLPHIPINVQKLNIDFFACSAHKMMGPMGIGGLWIKKEHLETLEPFAFGGSMINEVTLERSSWAEAPHKFEAGTPDVAGAIGWAEAIKYIKKIGGMKGSRWLRKWPWRLRWTDDRRDGAERSRRFPQPRKEES